MLSHDDSKIQDRKLILWARFHPDFSRDVLIPEIEANSIQYHVAPQLIDNFRKYRKLPVFYPWLRLCRYSCRTGIRGSYAYQRRDNRSGFRNKL